MADPASSCAMNTLHANCSTRLPKSAPTGWATMMWIPSCCSAWRRACRVCSARMHARPRPSPPPTRTCSSIARRPIVLNWPSAATSRPRVARNGWNWRVARPMRRSTSAATRRRRRADPAAPGLGRCTHPHPPRHGEDSPQWQERLLQTERIAAVTAQAVDANGGTDAVLANEVESALVQVGYHAEEAAAVARRLATPGGEDESTSRTELSARLKARARLGEHAASGSADAPHAAQQRRRGGLPAARDPALWQLVRHRQR